MEHFSQTEKNISSQYLMEPSLKLATYSVTNQISVYIWNNPLYLIESQIKVRIQQQYKLQKAYKLMEIEQHPTKNYGIKKVKNSITKA